MASPHPSDISLTPTNYLNPSTPGFFENLARANSISRMNVDGPPSISYSPFPATPPHSPISPPHGHSRLGPFRPPPIHTNFSQTAPPTPVNVPGPQGANGKSFQTQKMVQIREISLLRWRVGHACFVIGSLLVVVGLCLGLAYAPETTCKVPYMSYSYYDNYVPYADMVCVTHPSGWYAGAPILGIGLLCIGLSWYFSWVKVQEMKLTSKYRVAMV